MSALRSWRSGGWTLADVEPLLGVSLLEHVTRLLAQHGDGPLPSGGDPLPDEPPQDPSKVRFGAGSMDGIGAVRAGPGDTQAAVVAASAVLDLIRTAPTAEKLHAVIERLAAIESPQSFDQLLESLKIGAANRDRLGELARWLCTHSTNRQQVKAAIAILGVSGKADDLPLVSQLGRLEELTLYSLVALSNLQPGQAEQSIFALARQVDGWGRINALHRLADTTDPAIKAWMLRGGFANKVMDEEIAYIAASTGDLADALQGDCDAELINWAGRLLVALARGGPSKDMSDYPDGAAALYAYLRHIDGADPTLLRLQHLYDLERYLTGWAVDNPHISDDARQELTAKATGNLDRPAWASLVEAALGADDLSSVKAVLRYAPRFGLDPLPVARAWLPREPHDAYLWQTVLAAADDENIDELVELAEQILPWSAIKTGPANDLGLGRRYRAESCLDQILQRLHKFPGHGWTAIEIGLSCRVTRSRNMALRALAEWPRESWPHGAKDALTRLLFQEPNDGARQRVRDLLHAPTNR